MKAPAWQDRVWQPVLVGSLRLDVLRPRDLDAMLDAAIALEDPEPHMPYWGHIWPASVGLSTFLATHLRDGLQGLRTIEVGCGLGLAGLAAAAMGARVTFSDHDDEALAFVAASAEMNGLDVELLRYDWQDPFPVPPFPLVLGTDLLYERPLVPLVAALMEKCLAEGGTAYIADPGRPPARCFRQMLGGALRYDAMHHDYPFARGEQRCHIHRIQRP